MTETLWILYCLAHPYYYYRLEDYEEDSLPWHLLENRKDMRRVYSAEHHCDVWEVEIERVKYMELILRYG